MKRPTRRTNGRRPRDRPRAGAPVPEQERRPKTRHPWPGRSPRQTLRTTPADGTTPDTALRGLPPRPGSRQRVPAGGARTNRTRPAGPPATVRADGAGRGRPGLEKFDGRALRGPGMPRTGPRTRSTPPGSASTVAGSGWWPLTCTSARLSIRVSPRSRPVNPLPPATPDASGAPGVLSLARPAGGLPSGRPLLRRRRGGTVRYRGGRSRRSSAGW